MGTYGILRINYPMLPDTTMQFAWFIALMGTVNIVYGAFCAMAQTDLKRLVAYSSISHMGFVMLGMSSFTPAGINGAVFQMFNHGTITAMLFLLVGVIYDRAHHRYIVYPKDYPEVELRGKLGFGGLANQMPIYGGIFSLAFFAAMGLPGLSGFISEALCFVGAFPTWQAFTIISVFGIVITAGYILWAIQRIFLGTLPERWKILPEINGRELFTLIPLAAIVVFLGVYPSPVLSMMNSTLNHLNAVVEAGAHAAGIM
jgi:NADH-quinone oxidoreductase subunit M